jgi:hypothetical protein
MKQAELLMLINEVKDKLVGHLVNLEAEQSLEHGKKMVAKLMLPFLKPLKLQPINSTLQLRAGDNYGYCYY